jgi:flagellar operon protein
MSISDIYRAVTAVPGQTQPSENRRADLQKTPAKRSEFQELLNDKLNLSQHAETRIRSRSIPWNEAIEKRISGGIDAADAKGSRETLILADNIAVIANVKSRTIITAMDREQLKEKIFTNIDSAVLV